VRAGRETLLFRLKAAAVRLLWSYDGDRLRACLEVWGVGPGDALMVHASWPPLSGFRGRPADMVRALQAAVGERGLLVMPSLTYHNRSSKEFLMLGETVDVRRSPSRMGLLSEVFRRTRGVRRSLSPTHPLLAWGERAEWFLAGHEHCLEPFGRGSPFDRLLDLGGKILCLDTPFASVTFTHFLEDRIAPHLPFSLYEAAPMIGRVIDESGARREVPVRVLSAEANRLRREDLLVAALEQEGVARGRRLGNSRLLLLETRGMAACVDRMAARGESFFGAPG
jgi:aminoglycoside 3-N-acetyltransferase